MKLRRAFSLVGILLASAVAAQTRVDVPPAKTAGVTRSRLTVEYDVSMTAEGTSDQPLIAPPRRFQTSAWVDVVDTVDPVAADGTTRVTRQYQNPSVGPLMENGMPSPQQPPDPPTLDERVLVSTYDRTWNLVRSDAVPVPVGGLASMVLVDLNSPRQSFIPGQPIAVPFSVVIPIPGTTRTLTLRGSQKSTLLGISGASGERIATVEVERTGETESTGDARVPGTNGVRMVGFGTTRFNVDSGQQVMGAAVATLDGRLSDRAANGDLQISHLTMTLRTSVRVLPQTLEPVRVGQSVRQPIKTHDAKPVYPPEAQSAGVQGVVILEAVVGTDGKVTDVKVLRSIPLLDAAAIAAVKQWEYTTTSLDGRLVPVIMTVTVNFALATPPTAIPVAPDSGPSVGASPSARFPPAAGTYRPGNGVTTPRLLSQGKPAYTAAAMRQKIQGTVLLQAVVEPDGTVDRIRVLRSLDRDYGLDNEAMKAASKWRFAPGTRMGVPVPVEITIELSFSLGTK